MNEKQYLIELAKRYLEYANLPVMREREDMWYRHNDGDRSCTPVIIEIDSFIGDIVPTLECTDPFNRELEFALLSEINRHELVGDDRVIPDSLQLNMPVSFQAFGVTLEKELADNKLGYHIEPMIADIEVDFHKLGKSRCSFDKDSAEGRLDRARELLGDILPVTPANNSLTWFAMISMHLVNLMGMEGFYIAMLEQPEQLHRLTGYITDELISFMLWQEQQGLLLPNTGNHYAGSGSYGFTRTLAPDTNGKVMLSNLWGNLNSQESVGISAAQFGEFLFPYYERMAKLFGRVYWGCCEAVDFIWDDYICKLPGLSKVSVSAWCDEAFMGERLSKSNVIYSRKPSPNFIGASEVFDEQAFTAHIKKTIDSARDCNVEFILRDIYTLCGERGRAKRAVDIIRGLIRARS